MNEYKNRIIDDEIKFKLKVFGAVLIAGPKGCGKTRTAKQISKSFVEFQDEDKREMLLSVANTAPSKLLDGETPRLFDEWQDAPKLWGTIRKFCDDYPEKKGQFILTGSSSNGINTPHTGTLRISSVEMQPLSLYESGESNGTVSLIQLFDDPTAFSSCHSNMNIDDIIFAICRGGWPAIFTLSNDEEKLYLAKDLFKQTCNKDISNIDGVKRNQNYAKSILKSISRNICTLADKTVIFKDANSNSGVSESTFKEYYDALERLNIIQDIDAWCPQIRSKSAIRASKKRNLVDPSIAVAALGINPKYFNTDFKTLGFLFESLCIRDLKVYSSKNNGSISYYHDRYGLEADCVLHLEDGRYALIEFKLGQHEVEDGAKHLCQLEKLLIEYNKKETQVPLRLPDLKIIITATEYGYKRDDGVLIIPIGCLKD
jgi:uncharacterized protein